LLTVAEAGIGQVEEAHKAVKKLHAAIETKREDLKRAAIDYGKTVDSIATQLKSKVKEVESKLKSERDAHDAVEKAAKAAKEAEKTAKKQARINDMVANGITIDWVAAEMPDEDWMFWFANAKRQAAAIAEEKRIAEEFEAKQRKEREELAAKLQAEHEAETKRQAEELRIRAAEIENQRLADEAVLAEQRKAMEAERETLRQQQEEIRKAAEAKAKAEREAAEAARLEALKPEIEKAQAFADCMVTDAMDSLVRLGNPAWGDDAMSLVRNSGRLVVSMVETLR